ncbi:protein DETOXIFICATION 27-like [Lolium rigidum]|uniref:protein DETOXIFICATION 27-like n=1 Tax=Lolium rigidum TaxID=89674 RepID=UPI001F5DCCF3|nr:protein DETOXIFICATION 27-like [Lolium rigidum]
MADRRADDEERRAGLLNGDAKKADWQVLSAAAAAGGDDDDESDNSKLGRRVWAESKKLWVIVAPAIFSRVVTFSMNVITQAFAGHIGDLELAAISIANTVVVGFNFGLMVRTPPCFHPPLNFHPSFIDLPQIWYKR